MRSAQASIVELDKGKRYRVFVQAGRDPKTGKRKRKTKTVRGSRKDAEKVKAKMLVEIGEPDYARDEITFAELWHDYYIPHCRENLRERTVFGYEQHYKLVEDPLGPLKLSRITSYVLQSALDAIDGENRRFEAFKVARQALNKAVRWGLIESNPCDAVERPKKPRYEPEVLDAQDAEVYLWHFRDTPIEAAVLLAIGAALRRSEIIALDWGDVSGGKAIVDDAVTSVGGRATEGDTKTPFSCRGVHLPTRIGERLEELRKDPHTPVLASPTGLRMNPDNLTRDYTAWAKKLPAGVPRIPLKNLRHTSLTLTLEGGADLLAVSRRAGHSSVAITSAYYLRPHEGVDKAAAASLDAKLG